MHANERDSEWTWEAVLRQGIYIFKVAGNTRYQISMELILIVELLLFVYGNVMSGTEGPFYAIQYT